MATIKQIAQLCSVSIATVSRVLNQDDTLAVSTEVKNKIFDTAHKLGYVPPKKRRLKIEQGIVIGVADWHIIRKEADNMTLLDYVSIASRYCKTSIEFKRMTYGESVQVDGIIALGNFNEEELLFLKQQSYAILFIGSDRQDYQYDRIIVDYNEGLLQMVKYILDDRGYDSLGYIGGYYETEELVIGKMRHQALVRILQQKGYYNEAYFFIGELTRESGYQLMQQAIQTKNLARAVLLGSDAIAEGALEALEEAGLNVPEDVEVIIYKDIETLRSKFPTYTSIRMFPDFLWETAIKLILERITGGRTETMTVILPSKLCEIVN